MSLYLNGLRISVITQGKQHQTDTDIRVCLEKDAYAQSVVQDNFWRDKRNNSHSCQLAKHLPTILTEIIFSLPGSLHQMMPFLTECQGLNRVLQCILKLSRAYEATAEMTEESTIPPISWLKCSQLNLPLHFASWAWLSFTGCLPSPVYWEQFEVVLSSKSFNHPVKPCALKPCRSKRSQRWDQVTI